MVGYTARQLPANQLSRTPVNPISMRSPANTAEAHLATSLAPEDIGPGDFVSILYELLELPSYFWSCDAQLLPPSEPIRMPWRTADCGTPLKVKAVCLPFIFVKHPSGE